MMNKVINIQADINRLKMNSQQFRDMISSIKEEDASANFYLNNIKRLALQSLDLFNVMNKQAGFLNNQKRFLAIRKNISQPIKRSKSHERLSME